MVETDQSIDRVDDARALGRLDTPDEVEYWNNRGILNSVLRGLVLKES